MIVFFVVLCILAGAILPLQAALNVGLASQTTGPLFSTLMNFISGIVVITTVFLAFRTPLPTASTAVSIPWYYWCGGLFGAYFVIATMVSVPRLGAGLMVAIIVAGQIVTSLIFDHYGWLGYQVHEINWGRIAGAAFLLAGVYLVYRY